MGHARVVIAGTSSGVGKTTVTLGLMAALRQRGYRVQGFKVGPDYIDPSYHEAMTSRPSRNLDTWMLSESTVQETFLGASREADISVIEGVMGLYDGHSALNNHGSTAEVSILLGAPVILVMDVSQMARSAAAIVKGFAELEPSVHIAGVIVNRVGSEGHYGLVKSAIEDSCQIPVVGYLTSSSEMEVPERHLGLIPAHERKDMDSLFKKLQRAVEATVDVDRVYGMAQKAPYMEAWRRIEEKKAPTSDAGFVATIAVARDSAFNFYYPENLELLQRYGARLVFFSPLADELVPQNADGLYLGGGFPEEFAEQLSLATVARHDIRTKVNAFLPTFAECGGYMYLASELTGLTHETYPMVGVIPAKVKMQKRIVGFGYREVTGQQGNWLLPNGETARGHEFHYSMMDFCDNPIPAYELKHPTDGAEGSLLPNGVASYTHIHFASNPRMAERFVQRCALYRQERGR